ncbi:hypothetical protein O181_109214 [Austropuccinia psidii MF-1]|uniref:Uncharacterized protein n=1 Tax=Austropuccinia psidii MF-1 TaxID=1389203 RepID=A0A9Q3JXM8_9BASI|nr:hypothetical protein [Austropuccinia psidii MF-1]
MAIFGYFWSLGSYGPRAVRRPWGLLEAPWAQFCWGPRVTKGPRIGPIHGLDPLMGSRTIKILASPKLQGRPWVMSSAPKGYEPLTLEALRGGIIELWPPFPCGQKKILDVEWIDSDVLNLLLAYSSVMSSKLTELTESSPSVPPPSVLRGSCVFSQLSSPSMASTGHFDPSQTYDGFRAVKVLDPACTECLAKGKDWFQHYNPRFSKRHFCFIGKKLCRHTQSTLSKRDVARLTNVGGPIPICGRPIYSSSEVPISRTTTDGVVKVVKKIRRIDCSSSDPDAEGSDELDGEEVEVVPDSVVHPSSNSSAQPLANRFQSQVIASTPRTFQPMLAYIPSTIPPPSPTTSHARPAFNPAVWPSPVQSSRISPMTTSRQLQPEASSSRRRDGLSPLPFRSA